MIFVVSVQKIDKLRGTKLFLFFQLCVCHRRFETTLLEKKDVLSQISLGLCLPRVIYFSIKKLKGSILFNYR